MSEAILLIQQVNDLSWDAEEWMTTKQQKLQGSQFIQF